MSEQEREGNSPDPERFETDESDDVEAHGATPGTTPAAERFASDEDDDVEAHGLTTGATPGVTPGNTP
jgi:hypothetical protein